MTSSVGAMRGSFEVARSGSVEELEEKMGVLIQRGDFAALEDFLRTNSALRADYLIPYRFSRASPCDTALPLAILFGRNPKPSRTIANLLLERGADPCAKVEKKGQIMLSPFYELFWSSYYDNYSSPFSLECGFGILECIAKKRIVITEAVQREIVGMFKDIRPNANVIAMMNRAINLDMVGAADGNVDLFTPILKQKPS